MYHKDGKRIAVVGNSMTTLDINRRSLLTLHFTSHIEADSPRKTLLTVHADNVKIPRKNLADNYMRLQELTMVKMSMGFDAAWHCGYITEFRRYVPPPSSRMKLGL